MKKISFLKSIKKIDAFIRNKSWPLLKVSMENFIINPHETVGTRNAHPDQADDQAEQLELQAQDWQRAINQQEFHEYRDYSLEVTSTTARFLRAVAAFKRANP